MLLEVHPYPVFGFSANLDWSTLNFVEPIDDIRVCSACGVVARKTAFLSCRHVLCEPCYEQWKTGVKVCFLDGELCPEDEVHWMQFPEQKMMGRQVSCWNRTYGCETITDVSSLAEHFHRDCAHHCTCCAKCSSMVLRKNIVAHLQSNCANHVLHRQSSTPQRDDVSKNVECLREGLCSLESAFRSASHNDALSSSSLQRITASNEHHLNPLLAMADEVEEVSQMTMQASSEVKRSSERHVNQRAELRNFGVELCAELEEIKRVANEVCHSEATNQHKNRKLDEQAGNLQSLQRELLSISCALEEMKNKVHCEVAASKLEEADNKVHREVAASKLEEENDVHNEPNIRTREAEEAFVEVLRASSLTCTAICDDETIILTGFTSVIENELRMPIEVLWGVRNWSKILHKIEANRFIKCGAHVTVAHRYKIYLAILACPDSRQRFQFWPCVSAQSGVTLAASPKTMKMVFLNEGRKGPEHELYRAKSGSFLTHRFGIADLAHSVNVQDDKLEVCFKFFY
uniref:Putative tumor necrosis factor receptor-associated factor n=1 Tax=Rhipicephalus microplus TaxID=6941 RepID=A0A6M2CJA9_RHIMP